MVSPVERIQQVCVVDTILFACPEQISNVNILVYFDNVAGALLKPGLILVSRLKAKESQIWFCKNLMLTKMPDQSLMRGASAHMKSEHEYQQVHD